MSIHFDDGFPEPSRKIGFSQNPLVRDAENRDDTSLPTAMAHDKVRYYLISERSVILRDDTQTLFSRNEIEQFKPDFTDAILLGMSQDGPRIAVSITVDIVSIKLPYRLITLRQLVFNSPVIASDMGAIAQGYSISHWHNVHQHCGVCGTKTISKIGGYRRDCPKCDHKVFPRTDPAVIMLSIQEDKCLLGRSPHFQPGWYSTLAGFVEPGETLEDAVRRETFEEAGIRIGHVKYFGSSPWPFPHSLMIGVHCEALTSEIHRDENELEDCRWFTKHDVRLMLKDLHPDGIKCPPGQAISTALIREWVKE